MSRKLIAAISLLLAGLAPPARAQSIFSADSHLFVTTIIVSSTVAPIVISGGATLYGIEGSSNVVTPVTVKLYNGIVAACGAAAGTPQDRHQIPPSTAGPLQTSNANGDAYGAGISACITGGIGDSDTTPPAANSYLLSLHWKRSP